jgi:hypothetical protein
MDPRDDRIPFEAMQFKPLLQPPQEPLGKPRRLIAPPQFVDDLGLRGDFPLAFKHMELRRCQIVMCSKHLVPSPA